MIASHGALSPLAIESMSDCSSVVNQATWDASAPAPAALESDPVAAARPAAETMPDASARANKMRPKMEASAGDAGRNDREVAMIALPWLCEGSRTIVGGSRRVKCTEASPRGGGREFAAARPMG